MRVNGLVGQTGIEGNLQEVMEHTYPFMGRKAMVSGMMLTNIHLNMFFVNIIHKTSYKSMYIL